MFSVEIPADLETPVSAYLKLRPLGACFLLESAENQETIGRFSFIGVNPIQKLTLEGRSDWISILRKTLKSSPKNLPPLMSGWIGYISYEVANSFEEIPVPKSCSLELPDIYLIRPETLLVFDHFKRKIRLFTTTSYRTEKIIKTLSLSLPAEFMGRKSKKNSILPKPMSNFSSSAFQKIVHQAKEYIKAGDIFQVVLSHAFSGETSADPFQVYRAMRMLNPSPYMFFLSIDDFCLAGSSPEMLTKLEDGNVLLRPIAGTRPRGRTPEEDAKLESELLASPKENAEHSMLVDLGRNDLGRVCQFGSVILSAHKVVERYSHVMHLVSTIKGKLKDGNDMFDLFRATFPAGTVTGAPKIRAMEIITELERTKRGPYAGAMGYFGGNGNMDMCLTIRTIIFKGNKYLIQGGAGIVYDSSPPEEYQETLNKMSVLRKAVEIAENLTR
ncbi:MAG: anthranilate synthase component I family protein [Planctomycetota bacterium]|nr:anthranilate synthase component I family protein [Planctomycetota bacterium]